MSESTQSRVAIALPGAKPKVEVDGVLGVLPRVLVDGRKAPGKRGGWVIPTKGGGESRLELKGLLPGFQRFVWQGKTVFELGAHVKVPERIVMFAPALLLALAVWPAVAIALLLFFMNIPIVKNPAFPRALHFILPIVNTVAAGVAILAIASLVAQRAAS